MERKVVFEKLQNIIREAIDNEDLILSDDTIATEVEGWDSLAQVLIIGSVQNELGVKISSSEVSNIKNVGEFVDILMQKL